MYLIQENVLFFFLFFFSKCTLILSFPSFFQGIAGPLRSGPARLEAWWPLHDLLAARTLGGLILAHYK